MSTRQLLNMALGAVALLLTASATLVWNQGHSSRATEQQIEVARQEQVVIQDLGRQITALQNAENQEAVAAARRMVGRTVLEFDRNLAVLDKGGQLTGPDRQNTSVSRIRGGKARQSLQEALQTWRTVGTPLANLAAGEYSIYSAAGQDAVHGLQDNTVVLMEQMGSIANSLRAGTLARQAIARLAAWGTGIFVVMLGVLVWLRIRVDKLGRPQTAPQAAPREQAIHLADALTPPDEEATPPSRPLVPAGNRMKRPPRKLPASDKPASMPAVDLETVNAVVDGMTVDMDTIAGRTEKMRLAIDSVGNALQVMLDSLNGMVQDTTEGYKIVKGANNAASFTARAAEDLVTSAMEMGRIVDRVSELAIKTRQVAEQIDAEALNTGQPGEAFTSVVAAEVKGLARQTSQSTLEIENTVSEILATARKFEEAIGQIIQNVGAINKVSEHLGELMLTPAPHAVPAAAPLTPAGTDDPAPTTPDPAVPEADVMEQPLPPVPEPPADIPDPFVQEPAPQAAPADAGAPADDFAAKPAFSLDDDPEPPAPSLEEVAQETQDVIQELGLDIPEPEAEAPVAGEPAADEPPVEVETGPAPEAPAPTVETPVMETPAVETPAAADAPETTEAAATPEPVVAAPEPAAAAPEPAAADPEPGAADIPQPVGSNGNVFLLNKPANPLPLEGGLETVPADPDRPTVMRLDKSPAKDLPDKG